MCRHFVVEVLDVLGVLLLGLRVGLPDGDQLEEPGPVGIRVEASLVDELPEAVHHPLAELVPEVAQEAVAVVVLGGEVPGRRGCPCRAPTPADAAVWIGTRPEVDHRRSF